MKKTLTPIIFPIILALSACSNTEEKEALNEATAEKDTQEQVVVSGSRVPREDLQANSPAITVPTQNLVSQQKMRSFFSGSQSHYFSDSDEQIPSTITRISGVTSSKTLRKIPSSWWWKSRSQPSRSMLIPRPIPLCAAR